MKNTLLAVAMVFLFLPCHAQETDQEQISIVTYYPSPVGSYKILRLMPTDDIDPDSDTCERKGEIFFSEQNDRLYVCDSSHTWQPVGTDSREEASTCGWFRGSCPIDWTLDSSVEDNPRQVLPSEYPISSEGQMTIYTKYTNDRCISSWSACLQSYKTFSFKCGGINSSNPWNTETGIKTAEAACKRCFGATNNGRAFSKAERCTGSCGCPQTPKWYHTYPDCFCYVYLCYRCRYEGDQELPPLDAAYQISYCCPAE